jgi:hypothetical protein
MGMLDRHIQLFTKYQSPRHRRALDITRVSVLDIQNIVDWMGTADGEFDYSQRIPYMVPFERAWFEFSPHDQQFWQTSDCNQLPYQTLGIYIYTSHPDETDVRPGWTERGCRWVCSLTLYAETHTGTVDRLYTFRMLLDKDMVWLDSDSGKFYGTPLTKAIRTLNVKLLDRLFFAIALMQCDDVVLMRRPVPLDILTNRMVAGGHPGVVYQIPMVYPIQKQAQAQRKKGESEISRAMHICRNHMAL